MPQGKADIFDLDLFTVAGWGEERNPNICGSKLLGFVPHPNLRIRRDILLAATRQIFDFYFILSAFVAVSL